MAEMRNWRGTSRLEPVVLGIVCLLAVPSVAATDGAQTVAQDPNVSVRRVRAGDFTELVVENRKSHDVTLTLSITSRNMTVSRLKPETATYPPHCRITAARLTAADPAQRWTVHFDYRWAKGDMQAKHDDRVVYALPFRPGTSHRVVQGYDGNWSHKDADQYAVDFAMPEGTVVYAAREGIVVDLNESSDTSGAKERKYPSNFVSILHDDGTIGEYLHLQHDGVLVKIGQRVTVGTPIARSGNTGYSTQPHLHFGVYSAIDATHVQSHRVTFTSRQGTITEPAPGVLYTAR
jgi:murein DD-endopeptidase MepM/ murein hydrolase activator NlpD